MIDKILLKKNNIFYLVILTLISLGIGSNIDYLDFKKISALELNLKVIIYIFITYIQFLIFIYLLYLNIKNKKYDEFLYFSKCIILINLIQVFSLLISDNNNLNFFLNLQSINVILFLNLFINQYNNLKFFFYYFIFLIFVFFSIVFFMSVVNLIIDGNILYLQYGNINKYLPFILDVPRSSGIGRMAIILFIFSIFVFYKKPFFHIIRIFVLIPAIYLTQSRIILLIFCIIIFLQFIYFYKFNYFTQKYVLKNFILYPLIVFFFLSLLNVKNLNLIHSILKSEIGIVNNIKQNNINIENNNLDIKNKNLNIFRPSHATLTSGRFNDWIKLIKYSKKKFLIGYGSQADRFLINTTASNSIIYIFITSGVLGFLVYVFLHINLLISFIHSLKIGYFKVNKNFKIMMLTIVGTLLIRSTVETSYAVFGIDYILFIFCIFLISVKNEKKY